MGEHGESDDAAPLELGAEGWCWVGAGVQGRLGAPVPSLPGSLSSSPVGEPGGPAASAPGLEPDGGPAPTQGPVPGSGGVRSGGPGGRRGFRVAALGAVMLVLTAVGVAAARPMVTASSIALPEPASSVGRPEPASSELVAEAPVGASEPPATAASQPSAETPSTPRPDATAAPALVGSLDDTDWWAVLAGIDAARSAALAGRELNALERWALPGSPAWDADARLIGQLEERAVHPVGLSTQVVAVEAAYATVERATPKLDGTGQDVDSIAGPAAELVVVDERSAYRLVDEEGTTIEHVAASGARRWRIRLVATTAGVGDVGWRLTEVEEMAS